MVLLLFWLLARKIYSPLPGLLWLANGFLSTPVIVGTVAQCQSNKDNPLLWDITVKSACDIKTLTDVSVIVMNPR